APARKTTTATATTAQPRHPARPRAAMRRWPSGRGSRARGRPVGHRPRTWGPAAPTWVRSPARTSEALILGPAPDLEPRTVRVRARRVPSGRQARRPRRVPRLPEPPAPALARSPGLPGPETLPGCAALLW